MKARSGRITALFAACACVLSACLIVPAGGKPASCARASGGAAAERDWAACSPAVAAPAREWFLAEGCTDGGIETWVLVQNPGSSPVDVAMELQTSGGPVPGPSDVIPASSRRSYNLSEYVVSNDVSTRIVATGPVVAERAMYGRGREWSTGASGVTAPGMEWFLAEGCTDGGFETWVLVQNPGSSPANVAMTLQTASGERPGPRDTVPARSRRSYDLSSCVVSWEVSTLVESDEPVVVERAMYGNGREWGTAAPAASAPRSEWYMAEGCTAPGFETWLLVANPGSSPANVEVELLTEAGGMRGPADVVPPGCRRSYNLADYVRATGVSAVVSSSAAVVCERAMYGSDRLWGTCGNGCAELRRRWYSAEGCTARGFETWLLLQNPGSSPVEVEVELQTGDGPAGVLSLAIGPGERATLDLCLYADSWDVSAKVSASGPVACERSMYGEGTNRRLCAPLEGTPLYPFTEKESMACGRWPSGSDDYPYFGAPRNGGRLHAGIDVYPPDGRGAPVKAMKAGTVLATGLFYTRYTGEKTYAVMVDHGEFVANYAELEPLGAWVRPGARLARGQVMGTISGTEQLHFEAYAPGTTHWTWWYGPRPANLLDPTEMMLGVYRATGGQARGGAPALRSWAGTPRRAGDGIGAERP